MSFFSCLKVRFSDYVFPWEETVRGSVPSRFCFLFFFANNVMRFRRSDEVDSGCCSSHGFEEKRKDSERRKCNCSVPWPVVRHLYCIQSCSPFSIWFFKVCQCARTLSLVESLRFFAAFFVSMVKKTEFYFLLYCNYINVVKENYILLVI